MKKAKKCQILHSLKIIPPSSVNYEKSHSIVDLRKVIFPVPKKKPNYLSVDGFVNTLHDVSIPYSSMTVSELAERISQNFKDQTSKVRSFFFWITRNIQFDPTCKNSNAKDVIRSGKAIAHGFCQLFVDLCNSVNIQAEIIKGFCKTQNNLEGLGEPNHCWNKVFIEDVKKSPKKKKKFLKSPRKSPRSASPRSPRTMPSLGSTKNGKKKKKKKISKSGKWYLVDCCWESDLYFFANPKTFIYTHFPNVSKNQFLSPPLTKTEFSKLTFFSSYFFQNHLSGHNRHANKYFNHVSNHYCTLRYKISHPKSKRVDGNFLKKYVKMDYIGDKKILLNVSENSFFNTQDYTNGFALSIFFPYKGFYKISIFLQKKHVTSSGQSLLSKSKSIIHDSSSLSQSIDIGNNEPLLFLGMKYLIFVPTSYAYKSEFCQQLNVFHGNNVVLLQPLQKRIKYNTKILFKFFVAKNNIYGMSIKIGKDTTIPIDMDTRDKKASYIYEKMVWVRERKGVKKIVTKRFPIPLCVRIKIRIGRKKKFEWVTLYKYEVFDSEYSANDIMDYTFDDYEGKNLEKLIYKKKIYDEYLNYTKNKFVDMLSCLKVYGPLLPYGRSKGFEVKAPKEGCITVQKNEIFNVSILFPSNYDSDIDYYDLFMSVFYFKRLYTNFNIFYYDGDKGKCAHACMAFKMEGKFVLEIACRDLLSEKYNFIAKWIVTVVGSGGDDDEKSNGKGIESGLDREMLQRTQEKEKGKVISVNEYEVSDEEEEIRKLKEKNLLNVDNKYSSSSTVSCDTDGRRFSVAFFSPDITNLNFNENYDFHYRINDVNDRSKYKLKFVFSKKVQEKNIIFLSGEKNNVRFSKKILDDFDLSYIPEEDDFEDVKENSTVRNAKIIFGIDRKRVIRLYNGKNRYKMKFRVLRNEIYGLYFKLWNFAESLQKNKSFFVDENPPMGEYDIFMKFPRKSIYRLEVMVKKYLKGDRTRYYLRPGLEYWIFCV